MRSLIRRLGRHHATAVAYVALLAAVGGTAYAAATITGEDIVDETIHSQDIGPQVVGTDEIAHDAVTRDRLRDYAINTDKVLDNSLITRDIKNGSLIGADIADQSLTGSDVDLGIHLVYDHNGEPDPGELNRSTAIAQCPEGEVVLGGGGDTNHHSNEGAFHLRESEPWNTQADEPYGNSYTTAWRAVAATENRSYQDEINVSAVAICARV